MVWVKRLIWAAVIAAGMGVFAVQQMSSASSRNAEQGEFGQVPTFSFTDQTGKTVTNGDLRGKVWVANFVFTRCPSVCPMLSAKFQALQTKLGKLPGVQYVSISVDPEFDKPAVLKEYSERYGADPARWQFLTGPLKDVEKAVVSGFKVHMGEPKPDEMDPTLVEIMHGEHFVLVDQGGTIRGYYRADQAGLGELEKDVRKLAE
jgi:protein SCO1/2